MTDGAAADGGPVVRTFPDAEAATTAASAAIAAALGEAISERGRADWATTGGSVAVPIYRRLGSEPLRSAVVWAGVHVWWGDDRYVPYDHPLSNVLPVEQVLAPAVDLPAEQLHRFATTAAIAEGRGAAWCATRYATELREAGPPRDAEDRPVFDLVVLGIGPDGHVLSVFPESAVWDSAELALAVPAPTHVEPAVERVTIHPSLVAAARQVLVVAIGEAKAEAISRAWSPGSEREVPARIALRPGATWYLDQAAAAGLRG